MSDKIKTKQSDVMLTFSESIETSLRRIKQLSVTWDDFCKRYLSKSYEDPKTLAQFKALPQDMQSARKNNGCFIGAPFLGNRRRKEYMGDRQLLTFDIDKGGRDTFLMLRDYDTRNPLRQYEYFMYSTRTHEGGKGVWKLRLVFPLAAPLSARKYMALARIVAQMIDPNMIAVDRVSFDPSQVMYWPSHCFDIQPINLRHHGEFMDAEEVLASFKPGWENTKLLPKCPGEHTVMDRGVSAQDPLKKRGIVGAFNRTYDIYACMDELLPDEYTPESDNPMGGRATRYRYKGSTGQAGMLVFDDGMKAQSWHGTDPIRDKNVGPFDFKRLHSYAHLDTDEDLARAEDEKDPKSLPSYKAMVKFCKADPAVMETLRDMNYESTEEDGNSLDGISRDETIVPGLEGGLDGEEGAEAMEVAPAPLEAAQPTGDLADAGVDDEAWKKKLDYNQNMRVKNTASNLLMILRNDKAFKGRLALNELIVDNVLRRDLKKPRIGIHHKGGKNVDLSDLHMGAIRIILQAPANEHMGGWGMDVVQMDLEIAVNQVAHENRFHPIRDYLTGLKWDGVERLDQLFQKSCHVPDTEYHRQASWKFGVAAVARVMEPGVKFDFMPILQGSQGIFKTTWIEIMGSRAWTGESEGHFDDKQKLVESTMGLWFVEIAELAQFSRADINAVKNMVSRTHEQVRLSYKRKSAVYKRQFVLVGTTNKTRFLRDETGARRFWPIICPRQLDVTWLANNRDQIWAEAYQRYLKLRRESNSEMLPLDITGAEASAELAALHEERTEHNYLDDLANQIEELFDTPIPAYAMDGVDGALTARHDAPLVTRVDMTIQEIKEALFPDAKNDDRGLSTKIGQAADTVKSLAHARLTRNGKRYRGYKRATPP